MSDSSTTSTSTSSLLSGLINFQGLGSGTDFGSVITKLIEVETQTRVTPLETWKETWTEKNAAFKELNSNLLTLKTTLAGFDTPNSFLTKTVASNDTTALTATATGEAQASAHTVVIGALAQNDILVTSNGVSTLSTAVTSANTSLKFSYEGQSITISNISAGTTLETLVNMINNNADARNKVRAATIYDGSKYHLQLYGMDLGATHTIAISNTGTLVFTAASFHKTQAAANSRLRVDGYPSAAGGWLERTTNSVSDVISGLTLNLKKANTGDTLNLSVAVDKEAVKENVRTFISQVNTVFSKIQTLTKVDTTDANNPTGSLLTGNYGVQIVGQNIKDIVANKGIGFSYYDAAAGSGDIYSALSQLGITTDADQGSTTYGLLTLDEDTLDAALDEDPDAVSELFAADYLGESLSANFSYYSCIEGTTKPGSYAVHIVTSASGISSATINGHAAKVSGWVITGAAGYPEAGLAVRLDNHTASSTFDGTVNLKQGKMGELVDELADLTKPFNKATYSGGPLAVLQANYNDIIANIDDKIEAEKKRISQQQQSLRACPVNISRPSHS
jgi:flagellar hook-associated protein 2